MSSIEAKLHRVKAMVTAVQEELSTTKCRKVSKAAVANFGHSDLRATIKAIERICSGLKNIQGSMMALKSQAQAQTRSSMKNEKSRALTQLHTPEAACGQQQQPVVNRVAQLRPKLSVPQPIMERPATPDSTGSSSQSLTDPDEFLCAAWQDAAISPPDTVHSLASETVQTLRIEQMGVGLVDSLKYLIESPSFSGKITLEDLYDIEWENVNFKQPQKSEQWAVMYKSAPIAPGCTGLEKSYLNHLKPLGLAMPVPCPTNEEVLTFLDQLLSNPPREPLQYYVGPRLLSTFGELLHSGPVLSDLYQIKGVNSVYDHLGEKGSGTAFHREDALVRSCNLTLAGAKVWIMIREHHTEKFEDYVRTFARDGCDQFVRHKGIFVSPSELQKQKIDFDIHCTKPGDLIITQPKQYHAVINFSDSYAISTNFVFPDEDPFPLELRVCSKCGLRNVYDQGKLKSAEQLSKLQHCADEILKQEPDCMLPKFNRFNPPSTTVFKLAALLHTKAVIIQFMNIVTASRQNGNRRVYESSENPEERIWQHLCNITKSEGESDLQAVYRRYDQLLLAEDLEKAKQGRLRSNPDFLHSICQRANWNMNQLHWNRRCGQTWKKLSGGLNGLIYFIPTTRTLPGNKVSMKEYIEIAQDEASVKYFQELLDDDYISKLCTAGQAFQQSHRGAPLPALKWEAENMQHLLSLSTNDLLPYLELAADAD